MIDIDFKKFAYQNTNDMKVLILQNSDDCYCTAHRDWSKLLLDYHPNAISINYSKLYMEMGFHELKKYILKYINQNSIDVVYFDAPLTIEFDTSFIEELRKISFTIIALGDITLYFNKWFRYIAQSFDLVLSAEYADKYLFKLYGTDCLFFPFYSNPCDHYQAEINIDDKDIDVSFVGRTDRFGRLEFLEFLKNNDTELELYGVGTKNGIISKQRMIDIFRRSKVGLNFSAIADISSLKWFNKIDKKKGQIKYSRIIELALNKVLVLTDYATCLEKFFNIGEEIVVFEDKYDLLEKIRFYQKNDDLRKEIAIKGYQRAKKDCNPQEVCNNLLQLIHKLIKEKKYYPSEIILDDDYLKSVSLNRAVYAFNFLKQRKYGLALEEVKLILHSRKFNFMEILWALFREQFRPLINNNFILRNLVARIRSVRR